ncbi:Type I Iterative PKS [Diatrype stigma]|uniref:Type I Iterative PKS n=1 Tax=Diatrype stigma TaxID=117547 RepID=A0AAN9USQ2_9PEZI
MGSEGNSGSNEAMPIAIVGIGCRLPGGASSGEKFWDLLMKKQSARSETPPDRYNVDGFYHPDGEKNGTINVRGGHYLEEDISAFDARFFSISPAEALSMDPMQRMLLEVVYEATENAGIPIASLSGTETGCYVGCFTNDYDQIAKRDPEVLPKYHAVGTGPSILSNRVSFCFNLQGPSMTIDTACSSSLVAVHLACQSLRTGESKTAIVGATNAILNPDMNIGMTNLHFLSPDSVCHAFDSRANGYARGEGMVAVILKPLNEAIRNGDTIRAVIRGSALNSNGRNTGITLPSREAQARLIRSAYAQAGASCDPAMTTYCEAHGTGTPAGDPVECGAIGDALGVHRPDGEDGKLFVGSVKTNIGHLEGSSGLAGLIKAALSVEKGVIAPNIWFEKGNPEIDFDGWKIRVPTEAIPWPVDGLRRASVNGFGYGGTNSHAYAEHLNSEMPKNEDGFLDDLAFTLCQGAQWWAMGRELMQYPVFAESIAACDKAVQSFGSSWSLQEELLKDQRSSRINNAEFSQPLCAALQIALVDLYASWNIFPSRVVGHSSGEIGAAYATGALSLETAMCVAYYRGLITPIFKPIKGGMMAAGLTEDEATKEIEAMGDSHGKVVVACVNSPRSVTISGDMPAITHLQEDLTSRRIFARKLQVESAFHSHHMLAIADEYRQRLSDMEFVPWDQRNQIVMFSSSLGSPRTVTADDDLSADYWVNNMVSCVRFSGALAKLCTEVVGEESGTVDILIELGPHAALAGPVKQVLANLPGVEQQGTSPIPYFSALARGKDAAVTALATAASLFTHGYPTDLHAANFPQSSTKPELSVLTNLPTYSWNRALKYWSESRLSHDYRFRRFPRTDILGAPVSDWNPMEPRWRNFIRLSEQPWVGDHVVQGAIAYPAAGYCCMAVEAVAQMSIVSAVQAEEAGQTQKPIKEYKLRNVEISRALLVPQSEEGVEVMFSMRPEPASDTVSGDWSEFRIYSYTNAGGWAEHCRGSVSAVYQSDEDSLATEGDEHRTIIQRAKNTCKTNIACDKLYAGLATMGLSYGPEFQGIIDVSAGENQALGTVRVTDTKTKIPKGYEFDRLVHPATLDALLQMGIAALTQGNLENLTQPHVPTWIQQLTISSDISAPIGRDFQVVADCKRHGSREANANVTAVEDGGKPAMQIKGVRLIAISLGVDDGELEIPKHCASAEWEPDVDLLVNQEIHNILEKAVDVPTDSDFARLQDREFLAYYFIDRVLKEICEDELETMEPHHQKFFRYMKYQRDLVLAKKHEQQTEDWSYLHEPHVIARAKLVITELESSGPEGLMFVRMGQALVSVLRQKVQPLALMMKDNLLFDYYHHAPGSKGTYPKVQRYLLMLTHKYPDLEYLEIGAGTGGCTRPALEALSGYGNRRYPRFKSYTYTDVSPGFFEQAARNFGSYAGADKMEFMKLDIEQDLGLQPGFEDGRQFDVVVAANVLHATYDMARTIRHVRKLLRPGGKLLLLEVTHSMPSLSLVFGNLPGWWNCVEPEREYGPLLNESQWRDILTTHGFADLDVCSPDVSDPLFEQASVIVATAVETEPEPEMSGSVGAARALIVMPDKMPDNRAIIDVTKARLIDDGVCVTSRTLEQSENEDLSKVAVISFAELEESVVASIGPTAFHALQRLVRDSAGIIWVTRGGTATAGTRPELAVFQGLARSLRGENEDVPCVTIDLDAQQPLSGEGAADLVRRVFGQNFGPRSGVHVKARVVDREFSEAEGVLRIKRTIENPKLDQRILAKAKSAYLDPEPQDIWGSERPLQVKIRTVGKLDSLVFDEDTTIAAEQLPEDHVQIDIQAVGLSLRDASICLGEVVDDHLGNECAGVITHVGNAAHHLAVGDRVAAWCPGSIATVIRSPAASVQKIPNTMSFTAAAAIPSAFVTAYYSLIHVARVRNRDSVLIHDAASPVGQAAIQVAKLHSAQVFVTVDSEEKKRVISEVYGIPGTHILSNRNASFAKTVKKATGGHGVDIVINSLVGEALQATWEVIAPFGRFIELGKSDAETLDRQGLGTFARNVSFTAVDTIDILRQDRDLASELFAETMQLVRAGYAKEASPLLVEPFSKINDCMKLLWDGKHEGKIVLEPRQGDLVPVVPRGLERITFREDASYLLAGGLGGIGRSISKWMVKNGARHFIYVSRRGLAPPKAAKFVQELESTGARTAVLQCDVADEKKLRECLSEALTTMPPIRGVINGAMDLRDSIFTNMPYDSFMAGVRPKVQGSWSLHQATLQQPLDFFVMLTSGASFFGSVGQANYVAACTYQTSLAVHRRSLGLPATAYDVGKVVDMGYVVEDETAASGRNLNHLGMPDVHEPEFLAILEQCMLTAPGSDGNGNMPNGYVVTGIHSTNDPAQGVEWPFWSRDPVFSHMDFVRPHLRKTKNDGGGGASLTTHKRPLPDLLGEAPSLREAEAHVLEALKQKLARALMMSIEDLDAKRPMSAYGVDSLIAVELRNWLSRDAAVELPVFEILQPPSLNALARQVVNKSPLVKAKKSGE